MSEEYISKKNVREIILNQPSRYDMLENVKSAPSADVRPNIHGHWKRRTYIGNHETVTMNVCSECGKEFGWDIETGIAISDNNFCPNCGADMREPKATTAKVVIVGKPSLLTHIPKGEKGTE